MSRLAAGRKSGRCRALAAVAAAAAVMDRIDALVDDYPTPKRRRTEDIFVAQQVFSGSASLVQKIFVT